MPASPPDSPRGVVRFILEQGMSALSAGAGMVFELDAAADALVLRDARGYPEGAAAAFARIPLDAPLPAAEAVRSGELVLVGDVEELRRRFPAVAVTPTKSIAFVCVPLAAGGETVGLLNLSFDEPQRFEGREVAFLTALGHLGALALMRARAGETERRARQRMTFLARASHVLSESLDPEVTLANIAQLAVPELADWCTVDVPDEAGGRRSVAVAHVDPAKVALANELRTRFPPAAPDASPAVVVLETGESQFLPEIPDERLEELTRDEEHLQVVRALGLRSAMVVPVNARGRTLAAISLVSSGRLFERDDLEFAEDLGRRVGLALDNARLHAAAQASEARLAGILASAMDAIITIDSNQRVVLFNAAAECMFGYAAPDAVGRPIADLIPERFRAAHADHVTHFGERGVTNRAMGALGTIWGLRADGTEFPIEATISKLEDHGKRLFTVILRDVTERVARERQLEEAGRHKDDFLAMLGHELRNPLAAIGHAHDLQRCVDAPPGSDLALSRDVIERQVRQMTRLIDDLLDVTRIARGKVELRVAPVDLGRVARAVISDQAPRARRARIRLVPDLPPGPAWVRGDETRLVQVLENLIDNAIKFSDAGGEVRVTLRSTEAHHEIEIADDGVGLEPALVERLFEPFRQAEASLARARGGLGLGLAVTRGIVEMHGGAVEATSEGPGRGAVFTMRLPVLAEAATEPGLGRPPRALPYRRILLVEDNEDAAALFGTLLERAGAELFVAHTGDEGLALARRERPDLVLCDIGLPGGLDGYQLAEEMRRDDALSATPLVALSGYGLPDAVKRAMEAGFDAHITKPVRLRALREVLGNLRDRAR